MKEKNGFTLIELLAVIVILAVIALITTPIIINVIEKARKEAFIDSAYGILDAGKIYYVSKLSDENQFAGKTFDFTKEEDVKELKLGGEAPKGGTLTLDNKGNATLSIYNDKWCVTKTEENSKVEVRELKDGNCVIESGPKAAQTIIDNGTVESGEGLYKNPDTAGGGYVFKGSEANTNNYLIFDNKCWRVMSVEDNGQIKIIYYGSETNGICGGPGSWGTIVWNGTSASSTNDWYDENTTIRTTLESLASGGSYNGFSISNLDKVADHTWNVGVVTSYIYESSSPKDIETVLEQEKSGKHSRWTHDGPYTWDNKIGIINVSDGLKSSLSYMGQGCSSAENPYLPYVCWEGNYLTNHNWTLNADYHDSRVVAHFSNGFPKEAWETHAFNPVLYLKANIKITGEGTNENPFVVS